MMSVLQILCIEGITLVQTARCEPFVKPAFSLFGRSVRETLGYDISLGALLNAVVADDSLPTTAASPLIFDVRAFPSPFPEQGSISLDKN